jgi:hypothetical protein
MASTCCGGVLPWCGRKLLSALVIIGTESVRTGRQRVTLKLACQLALCHRVISLADGDLPYNGGNQANRGHVARNNHTLAGMAATTARRTGYAEAILLVVAMKGLANDRAKIRHGRPAPYSRFWWICDRLLPLCRPTIPARNSENRHEPEDEP